MSFVSHAQNMEDVILWRALKGIDKGFYVDVGANDASLDSVTKAFYERGWQGINLEPVSQWFDKLESERPRDVNLQVAAGKGNGDLNFYEIPGTGLSTSDKAIAKRHEFELGYSYVEQKVVIRTLSDICESYQVSEVHFLKIDVEGSEKQVLQGMDFSRIRPWIILVESTEPTTQIENHADWEDILLSAKYDFVYFDGLNRFYLSQEKSDLKKSFNAPPNVFDNFIFSGTGSSSFQFQQKNSNELIIFSKEKAQLSKTHLTEVEAEAQILRARLAEVEADAQLVAKEAQESSDLVDQIYVSTSWRLTAPLRWIVTKAKVLRLYDLIIHMKIQVDRVVRYISKQAIQYVDSRPLLRSNVVRICKRLGLYGKVYSKYIRLTGHTLQTPIVSELQFSPRKRLIYEELKAAMAEKRKEKS